MTMCGGSVSVCECVYVCLIGDIGWDGCWNKTPYEGWQRKQTRAEQRPSLKKQTEDANP